MAILIPVAPGKCTLSETQVFRRLEQELNDDWVVLHSLHLLQHATKVSGEADFVVLSTKGVFVIEVKGSRRIACKDGIWRFGNPGSTDYYEKPESPFVQAERAMFSVRDVIARTPAFRDLLIGHGVIMPNCIFTAEGPEIEQTVLLDARSWHKNLGYYVGALARHWEGVYRDRHGRDRRAPTRPEIVEIRQLLRPDLESTPALGTLFNGLEQRLLALSNEQIRALRGMENNPRTLIMGRAGTGKTVIARDRAMRLARDGKRVLYICFNQLLARHLTAGLAGTSEAPRIQVRHLHNLFSDAIVRAGLSWRLDELEKESGDLFGAAYPQAFTEAVIQFGYEQADVLIVDEAQDLLTLENLDALDLLVKDGIQKGSWSFFLDPLQNIYGARTNEALASLGRAGFASYDLVENCRNTREVATQGSIISGIDAAMEGAIPGVQCECVFYGNDDELIRKLDEEVRNLVAGGVAPGDIVILSTRRLENSAISGRETFGGVRIQEIYDGNLKTDALHFSTMHGFKGLERKVVLAIDLERIGEEQVQLLHYVGLSRAQTLLRPFIAKHQRDNYNQQAQRFGERMAAQQ